MKVEDCIFFQMTKASQTGTAFWAKQIEHLGVTASQGLVLNFLGEEDQILARILTQKIQITSATMTGILDRLEKMGLLERQAHPTDRRAILVCLTPKGKEHAQEINILMGKANNEYLKLFTPGKIKIFQGTLKEIFKKQI